MRTAFFGGTFDPPHLGHVAIARAAQQALALDQILFAPVALQPLKPSGSSASFEDRAAMTQLAIAGQPAFHLSLADAPQTQPNHTTNDTPNYTIETLIRLRQQNPPDTEWFLLLGADSFRTLHQWHRAAEIPFAATLIVASRPGQNLDNLATHLPPGITAQQLTNTPTQRHYLLQGPTGQQAHLYILPNLEHDISATDLRQHIQQKSAATLLNPAVLEYILDHNLYPSSANPAN